MQRADIFARDGLRCVYCGGVFPSDELTIDHVQPRMRQGDHSGGNVVTACRTCNARKGSQRLTAFLAADANARMNFFRYATALWPRHLRVLKRELADADAER